MAVLTLPEVKTHLNISTSDDDTEILEFIARAEAAIAAKCGPLQQESVTTRVRGYGRALAPKVTPILSLTSVTPVGGSAVSLSLLHTPEHRLRGPSTIEYLDGQWFGSRWYDVVYVAGRSTVPEDLRHAVFEAIRYYWETQLGNAPAGALPTGSDVDLVQTFGGPFGFPWSRVQHLIEPYEQVWL